MRAHVRQWIKEARMQIADSGGGVVRVTPTPAHLATKHTTSNAPAPKRAPRDESTRATAADVRHGVRALGESRTQRDDTVSAARATHRAPVVAGTHDMNPRTRHVARTTTARALDRAVAADKRAAIIATQTAAYDRANRLRTQAAHTGDDGERVRRASLAHYFRSHDVFVDTDKQVYAAAWNERTGELTLTRNRDAQVSAVSEPKRLINASIAPWTRVSTYARSAASTGHDAPQQSQATDAATVRGGAPSGGQAREDDTAATDSVAGKPRTSMTQERSKRRIITDTTIVVRADGSRRITRSTAPSRQVRDSDWLAHDVRELAADGTERTARTKRIDVTRSADGTATSLVRVERRRDGAPISSTLVRSIQGIGGDVDVRRIELALADGAPTRETRHIRATHAGVELREDATTQLRDGVPVRADITRTLRPGAGRASASSHYDVRFDSVGRAVSVTGPAPVNGREPLDAAADSTLGAIRPGERRLAFGTMIPPGERGAINGTDYVARAYIAEPGFVQNVDGASVFAEGASVHGDDAVERNMSMMSAGLTGLPRRLRGSTNSFALLVGGAPADSKWSAIYGAQFVAKGVAADGRVGFYRGHAPDADLIEHELAHTSYSTDNGAPSADAWKAAMRADQAAGRAAELARSNATEWIEPLAAVSPGTTRLGVTDYAQKVFGDHENIGDDWAESVMLFMQSQRRGGLARTRDASGRMAIQRFQDIYPNRARLLDAYYGFTSVPSAAARPGGR